jgi:hypothetical protein
VICPAPVESTMIRWPHSEHSNFISVSACMTFPESRSSGRARGGISLFSEIAPPLASEFYLAYKGTQ